MNFTYASHIPLIGGFTIAAMNVFNKPPEFITSYKPFEFNDSLLLRYLEQKNHSVPYYQLEHNNSILYKKVNIVNSTPPCSGISNAANRKAGSRSTAAPNEWMYKSANFILEHISPDIYVFENAPGLYTDVGNPIRDNINEIAKRFNYGITYYKTDTLLHGIPQHRPRTYIILVKNKKAPILEYENKQALHIKDYLKQIPETASLQDTYFSNDPFIDDYEITKYLQNELGENWRQQILEYKEHICTYNYLVEMGQIHKFKEYLDKNNGCDQVKKDVEHVIKKTGDNKNFRLSYRMMCLDKDYVYAVIGEMMQRNIHPTEPRLINMREYMHLMGLPHDFELYDRKEFARLPQNVPVAPSEFIIKECLEILKENRMFSNEDVLMQNNMKPETPMNIKIKKLF